MVLDCLCVGTAGNELVYSAHILSRMIKCYPNSLRTYVSRLRRDEQELIDKHFGEYLAPIYIARELSRIKRYNSSSRQDSLKLKVLQSSTSCSASACYTLEDISVDITFQIPLNFPLKPVEIIGGKRLGISESKWRSWLLTCQSVFKSDSINILDGVLIWKQNVEKSLEGIEPCPICYCVFHAADKTLPGPTCKTCKNKYHPSCLYKWFKSSGNSTCPMCRAVF